MILILIEYCVRPRNREGVGVSFCAACAAMLLFILAMAWEFHWRTVRGKKELLNPSVLAEYTKSLVSLVLHGFCWSLGWYTAPCLLLSHLLGYCAGCGSVCFLFSAAGSS